jgi:hypothetical protein
MSIVDKLDNFLKEANTIKDVPEEFMNDPLYKAVITAKDKKSFDKALDTLKKIRGSGAVDALKHAMKQKKLKESYFLNEYISGNFEVVAVKIFNKMTVYISDGRNYIGEVDVDHQKKKVTVYLNDQSTTAWIEGTKKEKMEIKKILQDWLKSKGMNYKVSV